MLAKLMKFKEALEAKKGPPLKMVIGVDGFVDEITHVVETRQNFNEYTRLKTIEEFGARISRAAGLSTNVEFVVQQTKLGGNGPILANALIEYGVNLTYIGALGVPEVHPVFDDMVKRAQNVYSICEPGHTDAVEFEDGKLIFGKHTALKNIDWESFVSVVGGVHKLAELMANCNLFGMENWTMIPHMSKIWEEIIARVFPLMPAKEDKPFMFFDLADPEKRTKEDIAHALKLIALFEQKFKVVLGLNEKELFEVTNVMGIKTTDDACIKTATTQLYERLGIFCLVVHPLKEAMCCMNGEYYSFKGAYCKKPLLSTGAGDNFNAGFCLALATGFAGEDALIQGVATSGFYVRNAKSPTQADVIKFINEWAEGAFEG